MYPSRGPRRLGRVVQWTLTGIFVFILTGTVLSSRYMVSVVSGPNSWCWTGEIDILAVHGGNVHSVACGESSISDGISCHFRNVGHHWQVQGTEFAWPLGLPSIKCNARTVNVALPLWPFVLASGIPAALLFARNRRNRIAPGCCKTCGYDLRASKEKCPECGEPIAPEPW